MSVVSTSFALVLTLFCYVFLNNQTINAIYYTNAKTFRELVSRLLNSKFAVVFDVCICFNCLGTVVSMQIVSSNVIYNILKELTNVERVGERLLKIVLRVVSAAMVVFPLTLLKSTTQLAKISPFSVALIMLLVFSIIFFFLRSLSSQQVCPSTKPEYHNDYRLVSDMPFL